ncbi:MAG: phosphoglycerate mutase family protein [Anaerolineae bacterium]|nr:phosphoglycerate mutase family protein [Anaerolineae bacterium]
MPQLILIRHSISQPDTTAPAAEWRLSHAGREACKGLAHTIRDYRPSLLISSTEPKAIETARLTAQELNLPSQIAAGLHEHDRTNIGFMPSKEQFDQAVANLFAKPDACVFGLESADQARVRFAAGVKSILQQYPEENLALVSHGTVIALFTAHANQMDAYSFWQGLGMPAVVVLTLPRFEIIETIAKIG